MNILFLDIDGVLNSARSFLALGASYPPEHPDDTTPCEPGDAVRPTHPRLDPVAVGLLRFVVQATGASIYVHSSWANRRSADYFRRLFAHHYDWPDAPILERVGYQFVRADRIRLALEHYAPSEYAILDDYDLSAAFGERAVQTVYDDGLSMANVFAVLPLLGTPAPTLTLLR